MSLQHRRSHAPKVAFFPHVMNIAAAISSTLAGGQVGAVIGPITRLTLKNLHVDGDYIAVDAGQNLGQL